MEVLPGLDLLQRVLVLYLLHQASLVQTVLLHGVQVGYFGEVLLDGLALLFYERNVFLGGEGIEVREYLA